MFNIDHEELREKVDYDPDTGIVSIDNKRIGYVDHRKDRTHGKRRYVTIFGRDILEHRLIWFWVMGTVPDQIDHIDGDALNNKWSNLRNVSNLQNHRNMKLFHNNKTGYPGIFFHKERNKYESSITVDGKKINLGRYSNIEDAIKQRKNAESKYGFHPNHGKKSFRVVLD